jgi:hypothetical protein
MQHLCYCISASPPLGDVFICLLDCLQEIRTGPESISTVSYVTLVPHSLCVLGGSLSVLTKVVNMEPLTEFRGIYQSHHIHSIVLVENADSQGYVTGILGYEVVNGGFLLFRR